MTGQNNQITETPQSIALDLENLNVKYNNLLIKYQQYLTDYTNLLQKQTGSPAPPLMVIPNNSFWGSSGLSSSVIPSVPQCKALCATTSGCSGATYNSTSKLCSLRSGEGSLVPDASNSYAIIPEETYLLLNIQSINSQLLEITQQILSKTKTAQPEFNNEYADREKKSKELVQNYLALNQEREKIQNMVKKFEDLNQDEIQGNITINRNYYSFILLIILAMALIILVYVFSRSSTTPPVPTNNYQPTSETNQQLGNKAYYIIFAIIILALVVNYFSNAVLLFQGAVSGISSFTKNFFTINY